MCRLYGFVANEPTKVDCSLVFAQNALMQQSRVDQVGKDHTDGWGIAIYQNGRAVVEKQATAAYEDQLFSLTAEKSYGQTVVAHVRRATVGQISIENTHPFAHQQWTFAHNGTVTGFDELKTGLERETDPRLQQLRLGTTDSEQYFYWLLTRIEQAGLADSLHLRDHVERNTQFLSDSVAELDRRCREVAPTRTPRLNFVLTSGSTLLACRWHRSLYMIERNGIYDCEICGIPHIHHHETTEHHAVAIASEPVTHEAWQEIPNHCVAAAFREGQPYLLTCQP